VAAQNCGRWYSFLWPGHKLHFFRHWKSFKIASIFTKYLVKNCSEKKKVWRHGRLWRPTWTDWLKKRTENASNVFPWVKKRHKLEKLAFYTTIKNRRNFLHFFTMARFL
jgi:hypothetical protein